MAKCFNWIKIEFYFEHTAYLNSTTYFLHKPINMTKNDKTEYLIAEYLHNKLLERTLW